MKIELGTQLIEFIDVGMYDSILSPEYVLDKEQEYGEEYWDKFDIEKYTSFIFDSAKEVFENFYLPALKELDLKIISGTVVKIHSPKQYNYGSDELYFDLELEGTLKESFDKYYESVDQGEFDAFLQENNKSYDGFVSFMPQSLEELEEIIKSGKDDERALAAILNYELSLDGNPYQETLEEIVDNNKDQHDFSQDTSDLESQDSGDGEQEIVSERIIKTFESWKSHKKRDIKIH
jgi:hypothetical protein